MTLRFAFAAVTLAAGIGVAQPSAAQTANYCGNRVQTTGVTTAWRPGGGYGVSFIDYFLPLRNRWTGSVTANVSVGTGGGSGFTPAPNASTGIAAGATSSVRIGTFTGSAGSTPPTAAAIQALARITC